MDLINNLLNLAAPPFTFFTLCFLLPPFQLLKFFLSVFAYVFSEDVAGKVVVITGTSSGIGEQLAYEYARRGACLVLAARRHKSLSEVADMCVQHGSPDVVTVTADVSNIDDCKRIVDSAISYFGRLDHLVSNAGITSIRMVEDYEDITNIRSIMASKAAMVALYETLRVEIGSDVHVTIASPGFVESEMTKGKHLAKEGLMNVDIDRRDVQVSIFRVAKADCCAKAIVNSVCRGQMYVTNPAWYKVTYWWQVFCPELAGWFMRLFYVTKFGDSPTESLSKKVLDIPGLKDLLYPSTVQSLV